MGIRPKIVLQTLHYFWPYIPVTHPIYWRFEVMALGVKRHGKFKIRRPRLNVILFAAPSFQESAWGPGGVFNKIAWRPATGLRWYVLGAHSVQCDRWRNVRLWRDENWSQHRPFGDLGGNMGRRCSWL